MRRLKRRWTLWTANKGSSKLSELRHSGAAQYILCVGGTSVPLEESRLFGNWGVVQHKENKILECERKREREKEGEKEREKQKEKGRGEEEKEGEEREGIEGGREGQVKKWGRSLEQVCTRSMHKITGHLSVNTKAEMGPVHDWVTERGGSEDVTGTLLLLLPVWGWPRALVNFLWVVGPLRTGSVWTSACRHNPQNSSIENSSKALAPAEA